jgi:hypothetical protein
MSKLQDATGVFVFLPSAMAIGSNGSTIDSEGCLLKGSDPPSEPFRMVQIAFELAGMADSCQDPDAKATLRECAAKLLATGREMIEGTLHGIAQEAYSGA